MRWLAVFACLAVLAGPGAAQDVGPCEDGMVWWSVSGAAGVGPCDAPWQAWLLISCATGRPTVDFDGDFGVAEGEPARAVLIVDGRSWDLVGTGTSFALTDGVGMGLAPLPDDALAALRAGRTATLEMPQGRRDVHLTGSAAALARLCG
jgi:hypothetical protein